MLQETNGSNNSSACYTVKPGSRLQTDEAFLSLCRWVKMLSPKFFCEIRRKGLDVKDFADYNNGVVSTRCHRVLTNLRLCKEVPSHDDCYKNHLAPNGG
jgi:hypothetical protein